MRLQPPIKEAVTDLTICDTNLAYALIQKSFGTLPANNTEIAVHAEKHPDWLDLSAA